MLSSPDTPTLQTVLPRTYEFPPEKCYHRVDNHKSIGGVSHENCFGLCMQREREKTHASQFESVRQRVAVERTAIHHGVILRGACACCAYRLILSADAAMVWCGVMRCNATGTESSVLYM